jgi:hypothetical protein
MTVARVLDTKGYSAITVPSSFGKAPRLEWLALRDLVIDPDYQRDITSVGRSNVRRIAANFNWAMFTTVMVSSVGGNKYAIVDGQHRCTAAALCGVDRVPCAIVDAAPGEQARAFRAINGNVTRMHTLHLHHAAVAAGEPVAVRIAEACRRAGVTIMRSPVPVEDIKPGQTNVVLTIGKALQRFGDKVVELALRTIVATGDGNTGMLSRIVIWGTAEVLNDHPEWHADEAALRRAFDTVDLDELQRRATAAAARLRGTSATDQFEGLLVEALMASLGKGSKRA